MPKVILSNFVFVLGLLARQKNPMLLNSFIEIMEGLEILVLNEVKKCFHAYKYELTFLG